MLAIVIFAMYPFSILMNMGVEIERKFIVTDDSYKCCSLGPEHIEQGYLSDKIGATVRIRTKGNKAFITIKSETVGCRRGEWEYEIPFSDAQEMLSLCPPDSIISKNRYYYGRWEIDEFQGKLQGLTIAEIELKDEGEYIEKPTFIGHDVTDNPHYFNSMLATHGLP